MKGPIPTKLVQKSRYNHLSLPFFGFFEVALVATFMGAHL